MGHYPNGFFQPEGNVTPHEFSSLIVSQTGQGALTPAETLQPAWLYGYVANSTAAGSGAIINLVDASATGVNTPIKHQIRGVSTQTSGNNLGIITFPFPIPFDKGIHWVVTATGTANASVWFYWDPKPVKRGPGTGAS